MLHQYFIQKSLHHPPTALHSSCPPSQVNPSFSIVARRQYHIVRAPVALYCCVSTTSTRATAVNTAPSYFQNNHFLVFAFPILHLTTPHTNRHSFKRRPLTNITNQQLDHHPQVNPQDLTSTCLLSAPSALSPRRCAPCLLRLPLLSLQLPPLLYLVRHLHPTGWRPLSARARSGATTTTRFSATSRTTAPRATDLATTPRQSTAPSAMLRVPPSSVAAMTRGATLPPSLLPLSTFLRAPTSCPSPS